MHKHLSGVENLERNNSIANEPQLFCGAINFKAAFEVMPGNSVLLLADAPRYTILAITEGAIKAAGKTRGEMTGKGLFETFPANPDDPEDTRGANQRNSFQQVISGKVSIELPVQRDDIVNADGSFTERFWKGSSTPVLDGNGEVMYIIQTAADVTEQVQAHKKEEQAKGIKHAYNLFMQAPVGISILKGADLVIQLSNEPMRKISGKETDDVGKPLLEATPELQGTERLAAIYRVMETGEPYKAHDTPSSYTWHGTHTPAYFNVIIQPYYEEDRTKVAGVMIFVHEVTESVNTRKELEIKEKSLQLAIEIAELGMYTISLLDKDMVNNVASCSSKAMDWYGLAQLQLPLREVLSRIHPDDLSMVVNTLKHSIANVQKGKHDLIYRVVNPQNGAMHYLRSIGQVEYENGTPVTLSGILQDVTQQVLANKKIAESEQRIRAIVESAPFPIGVYVGKQMQIEFANQTIQDAWGKGNNVIGKLFSDLLPELDNQEIYTQLDIVYTTGVPFHAQNQHLNLLIDGKLQPYYYNYSFTPLFDADGKVYGILNTAADVTDLNVAKHMVEESERNFRNLVMHAPVGICIVSGNPLKAELVNDLFLKVTGKTRKAYEKASFWEAIPEAASFYGPIMENVIKTGMPFRGQEHEVMLTRNGKDEMVFMNFVYDPIIDDAGNVSKVMVLVIEVTAQVQARLKIEEIVAQRTKELAEANLQLQQSNAELNQFAYIASHDLQEPLRKVRTFTGLMEASMGNVSDKTRGYIKKIQGSTERMQTLINDVLKFSLLFKEREKIENVDVNQILKGILWDYELLIEQKGAKITTDVLPVIEAVPLQMNQLFTNLISNALKFNNEERQLEITIKTKQLSTAEVLQHQGLKEGKVHHAIKISDNGIGFSEENAKKIFIIFQRLHGRTKYQGTGIGLALCKKIVLNHHGVIYASSKPNEGSSFTVILPEVQYNTD